MQLIQLQEHTWLIQGGANIGVIAHEGRCLIIDSDMDIAFLFIPTLRQDLRH